MRKIGTLTGILHARPRPTIACSTTSRRSRLIQTAPTILRSWHEQFRRLLLESPSYRSRSEVSVYTSGTAPRSTCNLWPIEISLTRILSARLRSNHPLSHLPCTSTMVRPPSISTSPSEARLTLPPSRREHPQRLPKLPPSLTSQLTRHLRTYHCRSTYSPR